MKNNWQIIHGDALAVLRTMADQSVNCIVTSPPYWGLRNYSVEGQMGLEATPEAYTSGMVDVFREARRVLRDDGTCWINIGDGYASSGGAGWQGKNGQRAGRTHTQENLKRDMRVDGIKPKDLIGIPWMLAFALRADGWFLRSEIIWAKPNPMPESVTDRPTKAHEQIFLLSKRPTYFYDADAIKEPISPSSVELDQYAFGDYYAQGGVDLKGYRGNGMATKGKCLPGNQQDGQGVGFKMQSKWNNPLGRNKRTVWQVCSQPFSGKIETYHWVRAKLDAVSCDMKRIGFPGCPIHEDRDLQIQHIARGLASIDLADHTSWNNIWPVDLDDHPLVQTLFRSVSKSSLPIPPLCRCAFYHRNVKNTSHFATFPPALIEPCILAGCPVGGTVLDPFSGAGTTVMVALRHGRRGIGIELNPEYCAMARERIIDDAPLFNGGDHGNE